MVNINNEIKDWVKKEKAAIKLVSNVVNLHYDRSVDLILFHKPLFDTGVNAVLQSHLEAREIIKKELNVFDTLELSEAITKLNLKPSKIDLGILADKWLEKKEDVNEFVKKELSYLIKKDDEIFEGRDVVLYGFGRIGRLLARIIIAQTAKGDQLKLRAIVIRGKLDENQLDKRIELLKTDSIHGTFRGVIEKDYENKRMIINGQPIQFISANDPTEIDYTKYGINNAMVIDNTGIFRDKSSLSKHLLPENGIEKVLLTAPGKDIPNVVYGVNHQGFDINQRFFSAASCTTNAIVPPLKIIQDKFGIENGHIETIHSYTNDQNLLDNYHKKYRRGRSAPLNLVITETGAGKAVAKVIPQLKGKLTGNAVRIPTPNGSLALLNLTLNKKVTKEEFNEILKNSALRGQYIEQIAFSENKELVSSDIIGDSHTGIIDGAATIVSDTNPKSVVVYIWYDNEFGYAQQVIRYAKYLMKVERPRYF